jgi:probable rRNA maturation factor
MAVEIVNRSGEGKVSCRRLKKKAERILDFLKRSQVELSIALIGNPEIQELNARYRKKNEPTDVLSFPSGDPLVHGVELLGDVVISLEQAEKQARKKKQKLEQELETLLIHGILHLLGYDHERSQRDAKIMRGMEKKVRRALCEESS